MCDNCQTYKDIWDDLYDDPIEAQKKREWSNREMKKELLARRALELWGIKAQTGKMTEEAGELIAAIQRYENVGVYLDNKGSEKEVVEELADVCIIMECMKIIFGENRLNAMIDRKLDKLQKRIDTYVHRTNSD